MRFIIIAALLIPFTELYTAPIDTLEDTENELSFCVEADVSNRYVYRGLVYGNNFITQPSVTAYYRNFSAGVSGNFDMPFKNNSLKLSELDLFVSYELELQSFTLSNNAWVYIYTGEDPYPATAEYIFQAAYTTGGLQVYSDITVDIAEYPGAFIISHGAGYTHIINSNLTFDASLSLAWAGSKFNEVNIGLDRSALNYAGIDLFLSWYPYSTFYFQPHLQYNRVLDKRLLDYIDKENSYFGILTGYTF